MKLKKRLCWCLALIVLSLCSHAQSRIEITGADTSAIIPIQQLRIANAKFVELKECREEKDSLYSQNRSYEGLVNNLRDALMNLKKANSLSVTIIDDKNRIIILSEEQLKKANRHNKILKIERTTLAATTVILTMAVLVLIK